MKNKVYFFAVCSVALLYACSGSMNPAKLFTKKWQLQSVKGKMYDEGIAKLNAMKGAVDTTKDSTTKAMMKQTIEMMDKEIGDMHKNTITCNGDGTCNMHNTGMGQEKDSKGKWSLSADGKKVVLMEDGNPKADTANIVTLTADTMAISLPDGQGGLMTMTYKSIQ